MWTHLAPDDDVARPGRAAIDAQRAATATTLPLARHAVRGQGQHRRRRHPDHRRLPRVRVRARAIGAGGRAARRRRRALRRQDQPRPVRHRARRHPLAALRRRAATRSIPPTSPAARAPGRRSRSPPAMVDARAGHRHRRVGPGARGVLRHRRAEAHPRAAQHAAVWSRRRGASTASRCSRHRAPTPRAFSPSPTRPGASPPLGADAACEWEFPASWSGSATTTDRAASMPRSRARRCRRRARDRRHRRLPRGRAAALRQCACRRARGRVRRFRRRAPRRDGPDGARDRHRRRAAPRRPIVVRAFEQLARSAKRTAPTWHASTRSSCRPSPATRESRRCSRTRSGPNAELGTYTTFVNLLDLCAVAAPAGHRADQRYGGGLPFGVQLVAPARVDHLVLALGGAADGRAAALPAPRTDAARGGRRAPVGHAAEPSAARARRPTRRRHHDGTEYRLFDLGTTPARPGDGAGADRGRGNRGRGLGARRTWRRSIHDQGSRAARRSARWSSPTSSIVLGFLCEPYALFGARDITAFGGWRAYRAQ